jgi:GNAT superfamily N-acetyltransferase
MAETVFLRRLSRWQAEQQRESFADLYADAYRDVPGEEFRNRQEFLTRFEAEVQLTAFDMIIGSAAGVVVGYAYGFRDERAGAAGAGGGRLQGLMASGPVFALAELLVLPEFRRRGVATSMLERLFARTDAALATVRVGRANEAARAAYGTWGWQDTGETADGTAGGAPGVRDLWRRRLRG